jgi:hypothetical protein
VGQHVNGEDVVRVVEGIIKDFGLNMFGDENWQKRAGQSK